PAAAAVAAAQFLPRAPAELPSQPLDDPLPDEMAQVSESGVRDAETEVGGPAPQHPVEAVQQDFQRQIGVLSAHVAHLVLDRRERLLGRVGVDIVPIGALLPVALETPSSGSGDALLRPRPLRTGRARFPGTTAQASPEDGEVSASASWLAHRSSGKDLPSAVRVEESVEGPVLAVDLFDDVLFGQQPPD